MKQSTFGYAPLLLIIALLLIKVCYFRYTYFFQEFRLNYAKNATKKFVMHFHFESLLLVLCSSPKFKLFKLKINFSRKNSRSPKSFGSAWKAWMSGLMVSLHLMPLQNTYKLLLLLSGLCNLDPGFCRFLAALFSGLLMTTLLQSYYRQLAAVQKQ